MKGNYKTKLKVYVQMVCSDFRNTLLHSYLTETFYNTQGNESTFLII